MPVSGAKGMSFPVVITSFEICMIDRPHLERYTWQYMILDEGHRIKNRQCKLLRELNQIRTISRLLLTGTPIQVSSVSIACVRACVCVRVCACVCVSVCAVCMSRPRDAP